MPHAVMWLAGTPLPGLRCNRTVLIYLHGFNSSSRSRKAQQLRAWFDDQGRSGDLLCPDLPHRPATAIAMIETLLANHAPEKVTVVGSSLGGWYATVLSARLGVRAVLINPAVRPHLLMQSALGMQIHYRTGEQYEFTPRHLQELADLDLPSVVQPERMLLLVETGDEALDYLDALAYYGGCRQIVVPGGDHGFRSFAEYIPEIVAF